VWKARAGFFRGVQGGQEGALPWRAVSEGDWWQEGQAQRCLQEKATNISWAQVGHPPSLFELRRDKAHAGETFAQVAASEVGLGGDSAAPVQHPTVNKATVTTATVNPRISGLPRYSCIPVSLPFSTGHKGKSRNSGRYIYPPSHRLHT